jgi:hypothetical protein
MHSRYGELLKKEKKYKQELSSFDHKISHWESIFNPEKAKTCKKVSGREPPLLSSAGSSDRSVLPEVSRFNVRFEGGSYRGK